MRTIKATFENGDSLITEINGTEKSIREYYEGVEFNLGAVEDDLQKCIKVEMLDDHEYKLSFFGRFKGALGVTYHITAKRTSKTLEGAILALYDEFEHVSFPYEYE